MQAEGKTVEQRQSTAKSLISDMVGKLHLEIDGTVRYADAHVSNTGAPTARRYFRPPLARHTGSPFQTKLTTITRDSGFSPFRSPALILSFKTFFFALTTGSVTIFYFLFFLSLVLSFRV